MPPYRQGSSLMSTISRSDGQESVADHASLALAATEHWQECSRSCRRLVGDFFVVDRRHRRSRVGPTLLRAASSSPVGRCDSRRGSSGRCGCPARCWVGGSATYTGTVAMFSAAGFTEVARTYANRR